MSLGELSPRAHSGFGNVPYGESGDGANVRSVTTPSFNHRYGGVLHA